MRNFPLIVSYYTRDTLYQLEVQNLIASCEKWQLKHCIESISSFGSWERNCAYKPLFLLEKLQQWKRPLFWVDADAIFMAKPKVLDVFQSDFAVRINQWNDDHPSKVITNSFYVNATQGGERVLKSWAKECIDRLSDPTRTEEFWDQIALRDVLKKGVPGAKVCPLPLEYAAIVGNPLDEKAAQKFVIGHHQASRRFKKLINESRD